MPSRSPQAVPDLSMRSGISNFSLRYLTSVTVDEYTAAWRRYITESKNNQILNLDQFTHAAFCHGTTQAFDHFYMRHRHQQFRFYQGEFMYHQASMKKNLRWSWLDPETLTFNDAVIISVPFSDSGNMPRDIDKILDKCDYYKIPVLLDLAYLPQAKNIKLDLSHPCIETVVCSISKAHDGAQYLRAGVRFQRENCDDGIDIANSVGMVPHHAMASACYLMSLYDLDYNWRTYGDTYYQVCKQLVLEPTDCLMFALSYDNYSEFNRGNPWHRVCVSQDIAKLKNENTNK